MVEANPNVANRNSISSNQSGMEPQNVFNMIQEGINQGPSIQNVSNNQNNNNNYNQTLFNNQNIIGGTNLHLLEQTNTWHQIEQSGSNEVHPPCPRSIRAVKLRGL